MPRCLYEVLGVSRDATPDQLRVAYRKLALIWHPDKNQERVEEATAKFTEVRNAYDVLSNEEDRAWYDTHRDAIIRGKDVGNSSTTSSSTSTTSRQKQQGGTSEGVVERPEEINLWPYFSSNVFSGFGDTRKGFYRVYNDLFDALHKQEQEAARRGGLGEIDAPPQLGNYYSPWESVAAFYSYWTSFVTHKDYAWFDEYAPASAPDEKTKRWMEEENRKIRRRHKKEFEDCVRRLASSVKKRDPRVMERKHLKMAQERERENQEATKKMEAEHELGKQKQKATAAAAVAADKEARQGTKAKEASKSSEASKPAKEKEDKEMPSERAEKSSSSSRSRDERPLNAEAVGRTESSSSERAAEDNSSKSSSSSSSSKKAEKKAKQEKGRALQDEEAALRNRLRKLLEEEGKVEFPAHPSSSGSNGSSSSGGGKAGVPRASSSSSSSSSSFAAAAATASTTAASTHSVQEQQEEAPFLDGAAKRESSSSSKQEKIHAHNLKESRSRVKSSKVKGEAAALRSHHDGCDDGNDDGEDVVVMAPSDEGRKRSPVVGDSGSAAAAAAAVHYRASEPPSHQKEGLVDMMMSSSGVVSSSSSSNSGTSDSKAAKAASSSSSSLSQRLHGFIERHKVSKSASRRGAEVKEAADKATLRRTASARIAAKSDAQLHARTPSPPTKDNRMHDKLEARGDEGGGSSGRTKVGAGGERGSRGATSAAASATVVVRDHKRTSDDGAAQAPHMTSSSSSSSATKTGGAEAAKASTDKSRPATAAGAITARDLGRVASVRAVEANSMWFQAGNLHPHHVHPSLPMDGRIAAAYRLAAEQGKASPFIKPAFDPSHSK